MFEDLITPKDENSFQENFSISKTFYTFIKHKITDATGLKTLKKYGTPITNSENKADLLNERFHTVFSKQIPMKLSALCSYLSNIFSRQETEFQISTLQRMVFWNSSTNWIFLRSRWYPDGIRPCILKNCHQNLHLSLLYFSKPPSTNIVFQTSGSKPMLHPSIRKEIRQARPTIALYLWHVSVVNFLRHFL